MKMRQRKPSRRGRKGMLRLRSNAKYPGGVEGQKGCCASMICTVQLLQYFESGSRVLVSALPEESVVLPTSGGCRTPDTTMSGGKDDTKTSEPIVDGHCSPAKEQGEQCFRIQTIFNFFMQFELHRLDNCALLIRKPA